MRLQLHLTPNTQPVPFDHLHQLTGALHKWLGPSNDQHDGLSLYSFGWLRGEKLAKPKLYFTDKVYWTINFFDDTSAWQLARGILKDPTLAYGLKVEKAIEMPLPDYRSRTRFKTDGCIVARTKRPDGSREYLHWDDPRADIVLTDLLRKKMVLAGLPAEHHTATVQFDRTFAGARTKRVNYVKNGKVIAHIGNVCPVIIAGTPEAIRFAQLVGVGDMTGSGFGALQ